MAKKKKAPEQNNAKLIAAFREAIDAGKGGEGVLRQTLREVLLMWERTEVELVWEKGRVQELQGDLAALEAKFDDLDEEKDRAVALVVELVPKVLGREDVEESLDVFNLRRAAEDLRA